MEYPNSHETRYDEKLEPLRQRKMMTIDEYVYKLEKLTLRYAICTRATKNMLINIKEKFFFKESIPKQTSN